MNQARFVLLLLLLFSQFSYGGAPTCHAHSGGNYCQYVGPVNSIYVNSAGLILLYFDVPISIEDANVFGMNITKGQAAAFNFDSNPEFAKMFYSTALAAQASGREITIQMRGVQSGYLKFDRIWLSGD